MSVRFAAAARDEVEAAVRWYLAAAGPTIADAFEAELDTALRLLQRFSHLGAPGVRDTRRLRLDRFPYTLHYRIDGEALTILAVAHQSRKPNYWRGRS